MIQGKSRITWVGPSGPHTYTVTNELADWLLVIALRMGYWVTIDPA